MTGRCVYRNIGGMKRLSDQIIEDFGGLAELARIVKAPTSTVNSWRRKITESRLDHLKLAAMREGKIIAWDTLEDGGEAEAA